MSLGSRCCGGEGVNNFKRLIVMPLHRWQTLAWGVMFPSRSDFGAQSHIAPELILNFWRKFKPRARHSRFRSLLTRCTEVHKLIAFADIKFQMTLSVNDYITSWNLIGAQRHNNKAINKALILKSTLFGRISLLLQSMSAYVLTSPVVELMLFHVKSAVLEDRQQINV